MKKVELYVEGGGEGKLQHIQCREGYRKLLENAGFSGKMPRIIAGGGRDATFDQFKTALVYAAPDEYPILLVDSEDILADETTFPWAHLKTRDHWDRPNGAKNDQAQLMVACMETWIMADRIAIRNYFGSKLNENPLFSPIDLEQRSRHDVQDALAAATLNCKKTYQKGKRSFEILAKLSPNALKSSLPHFTAFLIALNQHLQMVD